MGGRMHAEPTVVIEDEFGVDDTLKDDLETVASIPDVEQVIALGDIGPSKSETPGSIAVATTNTVYPEFCSNVVNCGMSLLRTGLKEEDVTDELLTKFCERLQSPDERFSPDKQDTIGMLEHGAEYVVDEWGFSPDLLTSIENGGNLFNTEKRTREVRELVPPWILSHPNARKDTPLPNLSGNHFIEFQVVDEVLDSDTAAEWGLSEGDVLIAMHGDYQLTLYINWHYANRHKFREHAALQDKIKLQLSKLLFHAWSGSVRDLPQNWSCYNGSERFSGIDTNTVQGDRYVQAQHAAMNFGYANRLLANCYMADVLADITPKASDAALLWDVGHDTLQRESIEGEEYWIHRKAAGNASVGKPAFISGSYNMDSFLGKGLSGAEAYLNSYDHGSGNVISYFESNDQLPKTDRSTAGYSLREADNSGTVRHIDRKPIERLADNVTAKGILSGVAWLRPVANIGE